eukprot:TRINITY_DN20850_c0_g1_i1.p2 TRINITY_DN20850_c0_g1~~TRINITY_DN20850_c0_g1_i1.p2  ORF type:complete len:102 (+),score=4.05 TRINITY_DN20850_c0_g1_i1:201-506(+)
MENLFSHCQGQPTEAAHPLQARVMRITERIDELDAKMAQHRQVLIAELNSLKDHLRALPAQLPMRVYSEEEMKAIRRLREQEELMASPADDEAEGANMALP